MKYLLTFAPVVTALPAFAHHGEEASGIAAFADHGPAGALAITGAVVAVFVLRRLRRTAS